MHNRIQTAKSIDERLYIGSHRAKKLPPIMVVEVVSIRNHDPLQRYMILSTLSISSRSFVFGFPKRLRTNGDSIPYL